MVLHHADGLLCGAGSVMRAGAAPRADENCTR